MAARNTRWHAWVFEHRLALGGSLVLMVGLGWLLHAGALPVLPETGGFARVRWWTVAAYALLFAVMHLVRSSRWYFLLAPVCRVPLRRALSVTLIGYTAINLLPFRLGEVVRPTLIRQKGQLSFLAATGTVGAERVIDGLVLSLSLLVALLCSHPVSPLPDHIGQLPIPAAFVLAGAYSAASLFTVLFLVMTVFYFWRDLARRTTHQVVGWVSPRLGRWLADVVERLAEGLRFLPRWRFTLPFLGLTAIYWVLYLAGAALLMWGVGIESPSLLASTVIMGVLALGFTVPNVPGFFGAFQISVYSGMVMFFPLSEVTGPGSVFVFLLYLLQIGCTVLGGVVALGVEGWSPSEALAVDAQNER